MKERPIIMRADDVRAILAGTKTQTRRIVKPQPRILVGDLLCWIDDALTDDQMAARCPYGQPGDRLWVREAWAPDPLNDGTWEYTSWAGCKDGQIAGVPERFRHSRYCNYAADWLHGPIIWKPGIHMPRWASRITLEITGVRVERLQDISEHDAIQEGVSGWAKDERCETARDGYRVLWEQINGPGSWDANPWAWVVEFRRAK